VKAVVCMSDSFEEVEVKALVCLSESFEDLG
jgi:hypothetical protein